MKKTHTSPKALPQVPTNLIATVSPPEVKKRERIFSKSKDIREDRGVRKTKTSENPRTSPKPNA